MSKKKEKEVAERRSRLLNILENPGIVYCYIRKGDFYYRAGSRGYSEYRRYAGIFKKEEAVSDALKCDQLEAVPVEIRLHNQMLQEEINDLQSRLINII